MKENENRSELRVVIIFTALLLAFGIAMLVLSLTVFGKALFWDEVGGTIINKSTNNDVLISYIHNNTFYPPITIKNLVTSANIGDTIAIRVNPANPTEVTVLNNMGLLVTMFALSGVMILGGIGFPTYYFIKNRKIGK